MIATTAAGAPGGAPARAAAPIVGAPGRAGGRAGRLGGAHCRRRRCSSRAGRVRDRSGLAAELRDLLEGASLLRRDGAVDPEAGRALEEAHADPRPRAELAIGRGRVAELRE